MKDTVTKRRTIYSYFCFSFHGRLWENNKELYL